MPGYFEDRSEQESSVSFSSLPVALRSVSLGWYADVIDLDA